VNVRVKICGITNVNDAMTAVEAGADALGFVFSRASPRYVTSGTAAEIIRALPPFISKVGVFVDPGEELVRNTVHDCGLDTLQFHGDESPAFCRQFGAKVVKAFRVRDAESLRALVQYHAETWLLDSYVPGKPGGTGEQFNWALAGKAIQLGRPVILAGGLTAENVARAVREVRPFAIDVSSGVEARPGKKDPQKLKAFIRAAKQAAWL
jgi:phosphoribosylanthranilate isomerase